MTKQQVTDTADVGQDIYGAICAAMGQVQKVSRDGRNKHDGYNFASIDDFLSLVNPICAANGLFFHMQESAREDFTRKGKYGENPWLRQSFDITVMHVSGGSLPPVTRTVEVLRNGAQAYGSAQSYALKQFLRSLFLIATGDKDDADLQPTDDGAISNGPDPKAAFDAACDAAKRGIDRETTLDGLAEFWKSLEKQVQADKSVMSAKDAKKAELTHASGSVDADEIPY